MMAIPKTCPDCREHVREIGWLYYCDSCQAPSLETPNGAGTEAYTDEYVVGLEGRIDELDQELARHQKLMAKLRARNASPKAMTKADLEDEFLWEEGR